MNVNILYKLPVPPVLVPAAVLANGDVCAGVPKSPVCGPVWKKNEKSKKIIVFSFFHYEN